MNKTINDIFKCELIDATSLSIDAAWSAAAINAVSAEPLLPFQMSPMIFPTPIRIRLVEKHMRKRAILIEAMAGYLANGIKPRRIHYNRAIDVMASRGYYGKAAQTAALKKYICYPMPPRLSEVNRFPFTN